MTVELMELYVEAAIARWDATRLAGQQVIDEPGVHGLLSCEEAPLTRLLITDDRAFEVLAALLPSTEGGTATVFAAAARCTGLLGADAAWTSESGAAMVRPELQSVPSLALPGELTLRSVRRLAHDAPDGVPLEQAAAAAMRADVRINGSLEGFAAVLRSFPRAVGLFAAVDAAGMVRATSGYAVFGMGADVMFVNTDPDWRGRGIGQAMTAAALRAAQDHGARRACLRATDDGLSIYLRLGFLAVAQTTHFVRAG